MKHNILPSQYAELSDEDKAFITAAIKVKNENKKKEERQNRRMNKGKKRRG